MLCLLEKIPALAELAAGILNLKSSVESISEQLGGWARTLRDSDLTHLSQMSTILSEIGPARRANFFLVNPTPTKSRRGIRLLTDASALVMYGQLPGLAQTAAFCSLRSRRDLHLDFI